MLDGTAESLGGALKNALVITEWNKTEQGENPVHESENPVTPKLAIIQNIILEEK